MFCFKCTKTNEIVNKFLLVGANFSPEMHLKQPVLLILLVVRALKPKKELENLRRLEMQILVTGLSLVKLVFNMICLMVNQNI